MSRKITLKDALHLLIADYGQIELAERYKSIYEDFDQEVYGEAVKDLENFLQKILEVEQRNKNQLSNIPLSEAVEFSQLTRNLRQDNLPRSPEN